MTVTQPSELVLEDGTRLRVDRQTPPDLPIGYHQLQTLGGNAETWIIQRPASCWLPPGLKAWGWAVQLYAARSATSWGIGDLGDLRRLATWSRQLGADVLLLNPLCAVAPEIPQEASPYYPSSRRFRNPLYLRIEDIPGADEAAAEWLPAGGHGAVVERHPPHRPRPSLPSQDGGVGENLASARPGRKF